MDGRLQCLECGRWFRQLGQHVVAKHDMSADDYRRVHELPAGRGLHAADILARRAELARAALDADPEGFKERLTPKHTTAEERLAMSRAARRESAERAGVRASSQANARKAAQAARRALDAPYEEAAHRLGYGGIGHMLEATADLTGPELAALLDVSAKGARKLRLRFGHRSPGRWSKGYVPTSPQHRPRMLPAQLAAMPNGEQPERDGLVACLECGRWLKDLARHVWVHDLTMASYREAHGLDPHELRARQLGYPDLRDLLAATGHLGTDEFATLLDVSPRQGRAVRAKHGYDTPSRSSDTPAVAAEELSLVPPGVQPERDGRLLCLECGRWFRSLGQHVANKHGIRARDYRAAHGLPAKSVLESPERLERRVARSRARWESDEDFRAKLRPAPPGLPLRSHAGPPRGQEPSY